MARIRSSSEPAFCWPRKKPVSSSDERWLASLRPSSGMMKSPKNEPNVTDALLKMSISVAENCDCVRRRPTSSPTRRPVDAVSESIKRSRSSGEGVRPRTLMSGVNTTASSWLSVLNGSECSE